MITTDLRFLLTVVAVMAVARPARADEAEQAETLFQQARQLMATGRFAEACPKLAEAQALHGGGGTLLALAMCHEGEGRLATALVEFREAHALANRPPRRKDRALLAEERIRALEPRVSRVMPVGARRSGVTVAVDGTAIRDEQWTTGVAVDGGSHVVSATAPGRRSWEARIDVAPAEQTLRVDIPELAPADGALPSTAAFSPPNTAPEPGTRPANRPFMVPGVASLALGAASVGLGSYFGVVALDKKAASEDHCHLASCDAEGFALNEDAKGAARSANVAIGIGLALVVAGTVFLLIKAPPAATSIARPITF